MYYDQNWRVIAERMAHYANIEDVEPSTIETVSNVWSVGYIDEMVLRDRSIVTNDPENPVTDRVYVQQDANFNVTSITDAAGVVVERYVYDPYGQAIFLDSGFGVSSPQTSSVGFAYLHQGGRFNDVTKLHHFRNRDYSATLGRWMQQDPAGYVDGASLYQAVVSNPVGWVDPEGLNKWNAQDRKWTRMMKDAGLNKRQQREAHDRLQNLKDANGVVSDEDLHQTLDDVKDTREKPKRGGKRGRGSFSARGVGWAVVADLAITTAVAHGNAENEERKADDFYKAQGSKNPNAHQAGLGYFEYWGKVFWP